MLESLKLKGSGKLFHFTFAEHLNCLPKTIRLLGASHQMNQQQQQQQQLDSYTIAIYIIWNETTRQNDKLLSC